MSATTTTWERGNIPSTPGANALIWIPFSPNISAIALASPTTPNLETEYIGAIGSGCNPAHDDMQRIEPRLVPSPAGDFLFMYHAANLTATTH